MSDSVQPHRQQPTSLPRPWDSPGKNTGVGCHFLLQCMKVKSQSADTQSCLTLSNPLDCSLPGSSVHGIFQARVLEWVAIAFSVYLLRLLFDDGKLLVAQSCPTLSNPWTVSHHAPLSIEFSSLEYWRGLPFPSPGDLPDLLWIILSFSRLQSVLRSSHSVYSSTPSLKESFLLFWSCSKKATIVLNGGS